MNRSITTGNRDVETLNRGTENKGNVQFSYRQVGGSLVVGLLWDWARGNTSGRTHGRTGKAAAAEVKAQTSSDAEEVKTSNGETEMCNRELETRSGKTV